ncbi:MAG: DNA alkylation repair protein [Alphaproteobacteria bacterium]|nr:DNA alkylation repair protein [Alphaproteobacteria bacterium]
MNKKEILDLLYAAADKEYRDYSINLITSVDPDTVIGVRTPDLRAIACDMVERGNWHEFIADLPHHFLEENQLHTFIISEILDFDFVVSQVNKFLPYVDNWATCDQMSPKIFAENPEKLLPYIKKWIKSKHAYTVRFAILCLMRYFLEDKFDTTYVDMVVGVKSKEYYVNMMQAWYLSTALAKQYDSILPYFKERRVGKWTHNCAIQKAQKSRRISSQNKAKLKKLRVA